MRTATASARQQSQLQTWRTAAKTAMRKGGLSEYCSRVKISLQNGTTRVQHWPSGKRQKNNSLLKVSKRHVVADALLY